MGCLQLGDDHQCSLEAATCLRRVLLLILLTYIIHVGHICASFTSFFHQVPHFGPYFDASRPLGADDGTGTGTVLQRPNPYITNGTMDAATFFDRVEHPVPGEHIYYSREIDQFDGGAGWALSDVVRIRNARTHECTHARTHARTPRLQTCSLTLIADRESESERDKERETHAGSA